MKQNLIGIALVFLGLVLILPLLSGFFFRIFIFVLGVHFFFAGIKILGPKKNKQHKKYYDYTHTYSTSYKDKH